MAHHGISCPWGHFGRPTLRNLEKSMEHGPRLWHMSGTQEPKWATDDEMR
jgi:hypothetical protein